MFYFSRFYILFLVIFNLSLLHLAKADEAAALCAFIVATNINSKRNDWRCDNTANRCSWSGITCIEEILTLIDLSGAGINGTLPAEIGSLKNLQGLDLSRNEFSGTLPAEIGSLTILEHLGLDSNSFSGTLPAEMWSLTNLQVLGLGSNEFSGTLPSQIGSFSNLYHLYIGSNYFTGPIPTEIIDLMASQDPWGQNRYFNYDHYNMAADGSDNNESPDDLPSNNSTVPDDSNNENPDDNSPSNNSTGSNPDSSSCVGSSVLQSDLKTILENDRKILTKQEKMLKKLKKLKKLAKKK